MMDYYIRESCRLCSKNSLERVLKLNDSPLCDAYLNHSKNQRFYPLGLNKCADCDFVQLNTVVSPEIIYRDYIYVTTSSSGLQKHFAEYSAEVCKYLGYNGQELVIDVGSNDGMLLKEFQKNQLRVIGLEPAIDIAKKANDEGIITYPDFFNQDLAARIASDNGHADLVTVNNLLANIDDLYSFMMAVDTLLSSEGVFVVESSYLFKMVENMVFDFIYHEHLSYFSVNPFATFLRKFRMHIIRIQEVPTKGGSLRYYVARINSKWSIDPNVDQILWKEINKKSLLKTFQKYAEKIEEEKNNINDFLDEFKGKKIVGYGASATSTTLISHFELQKHLAYLVDDNHSKIGTYSPGFHIPVHSLDTMWKAPPDVVVILAWRFKNEIIKKLEDLPSKVVVPLPVFHEVN